MDNLIIDVREQSEFKNEYIEGSINIPLSELICSIPGIAKHYKDKKIIIMCKSGKRASIAKAELLKQDSTLDAQVYEGGITLWKAQGNPTIFKKSTIPVFRQVLITAGLFILLFTFLSIFINFNFIYLTIFMACGLMFAGITGVCGLATLLSKMPWNK